MPIFLVLLGTSMRDLFADVMSVHDRNMKHAHAIEFD